jgi:hypothetical protein
VVRVAGEERTMNAIGAARLYLMARGRGGANYEDDLGALTELLTLGAQSGYRTGLEKAKEIYREIHPGGCRMLSQGDACECFLCRCDREIERNR